VTPPAPDAEPEPVAVADGGDVTIITAPSNEASDDEIPNDWVERIVNLENRVDNLETRLPVAEVVAEVAQSTAEEALSVATDVIENADELAEDVATEVVESAEIVDDEETGEQTLEVQEDAIEPRGSRVHPLFRSREDWSRR
jgi:hypothetical protein